MRELSRWPLLMAALTLTGSWVALDLTSQGPVAYGIAALASACVGAFLYAEGARHREWWQQPGDTPTGPAAGQDDQQSG